MGGPGRLCGHATEGAGWRSRSRADHRSMSRLRSKVEETLGWVVLLALVVGCLIVLRPFVSALVWGWSSPSRVGPSTVGCQAARRPSTLAALVMTLSMFSLSCCPLYHRPNVGGQCEGADHGDTALDSGGPPAPPAWLDKVPVRSPGDGILAELAQDTANFGPRPKSHRTDRSGCSRAGWRWGKACSSGLEHLHRLLPLPRRGLPGPTVDCLRLTA